jgi:hypothetical protein
MQTTHTRDMYIIIVYQTGRSFLDPLCIYIITYILLCILYTYYYIVDSLCIYITAYILQYTIYILLYSNICK